MSRARFSIVIPTRQRHETLHYAIQSVLFQDFPDYELVVQDNCSGPETWDVVKQFRSPKLKYQRSPRVLPMAENFEAALPLCEGEYVYYMGDDDAIMPDGMRLADQILRRADLEVLAWQKYTYWWDNAIEPSMRGRLFVHFGVGFRVLDSEDTLQRYYNWQIGMGDLPSIYTGFVRRSFINQVMERYGKYFALVVPDTYTGILNLALSRKAGWFERGLSLCGNSGNSTGSAWFYRSKGRHRRDAYHADEGQSEQELMHPSLIPSVNLEVNHADTMLRAKELLFPKDERFQVRIPQVLNAMAANINRDPDSYDDVLAEIRALAEKHTIDMGSLRIPPRAQAARPFFQGPIFGQDQRLNAFALNCAEAGVHNVAQAARLAAAALPVVTIQ